MDNRIGTYHKPNKTGRAWYVLLQGDKPADGETISVIRRDGIRNTVQVFDAVPAPNGPGWVCRFKHSQTEGVAVEGKDFLSDETASTKPDSEATVEQQERIEIDVSAVLEAARQALAQDGKAIIAGIEDRVHRAVKTALESVTGRVEYVNPDKVVIDCGQQHKTFPELLQYVSLGLNVWLPGPAGSGKTTAAKMVAKAMNLPFYHSGKVLMEHSLVGYMDAHGKYVSTPFYQAYRNGGLFLQDEADGSEAKALLALNMAIENNEMAFPCGIIKRHKDFHLIAAANTFGLGADSDYVGRNQQDKAFLDRFVTLAWHYDEDFEALLSGNAKWAHRVQALRAAAKAKGIKVLITPRASIKGALALAAGIPQEQVERDFVRKAMTDEQWLSITRGTF